MQVNNPLTTNYTPLEVIKNRPEKNQDLNQDQKDTLRETTALKAGKESKEAQLEAYVAGTKQYNEISSTTSDENDTSSSSTQNYTEFAADIRRANNYATLVENGVDTSKISDKPSIQPIQNELDQDQKDSLREGIVSVAGYQSTKSQIEAYKAGAEQADNSFNETAAYVEKYNEFAADIKRSESLNTYIEYNNYLVG